MIFLSAQPDDIYFIWQLQVLTQNLKDLGVQKHSVKILVGYKGDSYNPEWDRWLHTIHGDIYFYKDDREISFYLSSLRPNIIKKFFKENPQYNTSYVFYHDADILFSSLPNFTGMSDGLIHVSNTNGYTSYVNYIKTKNVPEMEQDLRETIGISEQTLLENDRNTGGAQYYFKGLTYDFWNAFEIKCELFHNTFFKNRDRYYNIYKEYQIAHNQHIDSIEGFMQIWTTDMWVFQWLLWSKGYKCYANPELDFSWPNYNINDWTKYKIFHNSGVYDNTYFDKGSYKQEFPYGKINHLEPKVGDNSAIQQMYINAIVNKGNELGYTPVTPDKVKSYSCIYMCKDPTNEEVNNIIINFLQQTVQNKELIIYNYGINTLSTNIKNQVRIYNVNKSFITGEYYSTEEEVYTEVCSLALNETIIKWNYQQDINYLKNL
jgi:hypothetical protein